MADNVISKIKLPDNQEYILKDSNAARSNHTHDISLEKDTSGTNQLTLAAGTKYKLTAGGESYIFTTPADANNKVTIAADTTTNANYPLVFGSTNTSTTTAKTEGLQKSTTKFYVNPSTGNIQATTFNGITLAAAAAKSITDNSSNADVTSSDTNLITGRTLYYQLAKKGYTTNTGTVTKIMTGSGLTGGPITTTGTISIATGGVTNDMLAGSIANGKLANSSISIAGTSVSLGSTLAAETLRTNLGLSNAMHFIGKATVAITDGSTTNPTINGYDFTNKKAAGDVIIDKDTAYEYVWTTEDKWERLGGDSSYKVTQTAVAKPDAATNKWVSAIGQNVNGVIDASYTTLDTSGTWSGSAGRLTNLTTSDNASSTDTWRYVWFSYNDLVTGRPAYSNKLVYQTSTNTLKIDTGTLTATQYSGNAATATTATNLANKPSIAASGNNITITAGGKTSDAFTVPYATSAGTATTATNLSTAPTITKTGTSTIDLTAGTAYTLTVGGQSVVFKTPADSDTKVTLAAITSGTAYYPVVGTGTGNAQRQIDTTGFAYKGTNGTTSAVGAAELTLGNSTASGTANNKQGKLTLYGSTAYTHTLLGAPTSARTITLPDATGTVELTSHIHGNLTHDGKITSTTTIANGDKLVIVDSDTTAGGKIIGSSITFDGSTATKALTQKGTWETFNNYSHPTGDGNLHVPATGTTHNGQVLKAGSTAGSISWGTLSASDVGAATSGHTHATTIAEAASGDTNSLTLAFNKKYKLTTGGTNFVFTTPANPNTDTKVNVSARGTTKAYLLATSTSPTTSAQGVTALAETGVYLDTAGELVATKFTGVLNGTANIANKLGTADKGSGTKPIYLAGGVPTECSTYAGGTAVTLNGASKAASTASFYAPTSAGNNTQALVGGTPTWTNISPSISIGAGTASAAPTVNVSVLGKNGTAQSITTASTAVYGVTKLQDGVSSDSTVLAATAKAAKTASTSATHTLATTTKFFVTGCTSSTTNTAGDDFDTGVYVTTTAGEFSAVRHSYNVAGAERAYTHYNMTDQSIDFVFV